MAGENTRGRLVEVHESLQYFGESADMQRLIARTVAKLPDDVMEFACSRCRFITVSFGATYPGEIGLDWVKRRSRNMWVIVLGEKLPTKDAESIVAHEIAHAWLHHSILDYRGSGFEVEKEAAKLTQEWGFSGKGASVKYCTRSIPKGSKT